ncbi:hypothetical protein FPSE_05066 [Fusarium pseudograminearum CS3096]|uniref:Uncharacterized protein n=1 Tax=Fusarium pseudograminearum (strain CS3096) TaxID=1028729 RepID=K3UQT3_FUSPC|nr:hypothetical protein FPSE_05066 [Fusarium pseudograminearum CS3096]EKJ74731.1 hypothetical protein FPSE_05066 [Fusarium pseudograminearum CS3096]
MGAMHGKSSACITSLEYNSELEEHIDSLTESGAVSEDEIKRVIARLCQNMVQFTDFMRLRTNEEMELYVWKSFLRPIKALMKLPHPQGNFVAARMVLYLAYQIHQTLDEKEYLRQADAEKATMPLCQLCIKLDETLLKALRNIWKASTDFEEDFNWVFVDDRIHLAPGEVAMDDNDLKIAQALSPSERTRVSKENGVEYAYYSDPFGVNKANPTPYKGPIPRWDCGQEDTDSFIWSTKSSDGPIRLEISYDVRIPRAGYNGLSPPDSSIPMFRRSKQFCLDARQLSEAERRKQVHFVLDKIVRYYKVPPEIHYQILEYLPYREAFPYIQKLDLVAAYAPFPAASGLCEDCCKGPKLSWLRRTCPGLSIWIWNLPLRCFHVFHLGQYRNWTLCAHGAECTGHHDSHDRDWIVERGPGLSLFIEREISRLNDEFVSLDQVGLGPALKIRLDTEEEDRDRQQRLALGQGIYQDSVDDWKMSGGLGGLVDCMLHGRVLVGAWGRDGADKGTMQVPTQWAHGGGLKDQERAIQAIRDLHAWPGCCEWC